MFVYELNNIMAYPLCSNFKSEYFDLFTYQYVDIPEFQERFFLNYLNALKSLYLKLQNNTDEFIAIKFYEGVIRTIYYVIDHPSYIPGNGIDKNTSFNYDHLIERTKSHLIGYLSRAESEFMNHINSNAAFFLGQYHISKELIKIFKKFNNLIKE